jgi:hypothetical protein
VAERKWLDALEGAAIWSGVLLTTIGISGRKNGERFPAAETPGLIG